MKVLLASLLASLLTFSVLAQTPPEAVLDKADIGRYITTGKQMMREFESLDDIYVQEEDEEEMTYEQILNSYIEALKGNDAIEIIEKYGWEKETFGQKIMAITFGATYLMAKRGLKEMPEDQRKMMEDLYLKPYKSYVNEDDLEVIEPRIEELELLFKDE